MYSDYDSDARSAYGSVASNDPPPRSAASKRRARRSRASETADHASDHSSEPEQSDSGHKKNHDSIMSKGYLDKIQQLCQTITQATIAGKNVTADNKKLIVDCARQIQIIAGKAKTHISVQDHVASLKETIKEEIAKIRIAAPAQIAPIRSYAAAASGNTRAPANAMPFTPAAQSSAGPPKTTNGHTLIVSVKDDAPNTTNVTEAWKKAISFRQTRYAPTRTRQLNNNKLVVTFDTEQQRDETINRLQNAANITVEKAKQFLPMVILKGVNKELKREDLVETLAFQNNIDKADIRLCFLTRNRSDKLYNAVLEAQPATWKRLLENGRVNVDYQKIHIENFQRNTQCYRCLQFGHTKTRCTAEVTPCSYCAATDHQYDKCPHKNNEEKRKCYNCATHNARTKASDDIKHSATNPHDCPRIALAMLRISQRTNYG